MIERQEIDGKPATVASIEADFTPCEPDEAEPVKVVFDDGTMIMLRPAEKGDVGARVH